MEHLLPDVDAESLTASVLRTPESYGCDGIGARESARGITRALLTAVSAGDNPSAL
jgi:hypothetical protein